MQYARTAVARRLTLLLVAALLLAALLPVGTHTRVARADDPNFAFPSTLVGSGNITTGVALADVNGDGARDIVLVNNGAAPQVFLSKNDGSGGFAPPFTLPGALTTTNGVAAGDLNNDGAPDLVLANTTSANQVFLNKNDGSGSFNAPTALTVPGFGVVPLQSYSVTLADFDNDGSTDIVFGNYGLFSAVYQNDGSGNVSFSEALPADFSAHSTLGVAAGDLNGDNLPDVVLGNFGEPSQVYLNDPNNPGTFLAPTDLGGSGRRTVSVALGDLNGDGELDIVLGNNTDPNNGQPIAQPSQVFLNSAASPGSFGAPTDLAGSGESYTFSAALADINADGAPDIVLANNGDFSQVYLNTNDGSGSFAVPTDLPGSGNFTQAAALGDLNGDGGVDLVLANSQAPSQIFLNSRPGRYIAPSFAFPVVLSGSDRPTQSVAIGDLDGDGALDVVLANSGVRDIDPNNPNNEIYVPRLSQVFLNKNDGSGGFRPAFDLPGSGRASRTAALGDLDGDGALDVVLANGGITLNGQFFPHLSQVFLNKNDGSGTFHAPIDILNSTTRLLYVALGDLNGDGRLDMVAGNRDQQSQIYLNDPNNPSIFSGPTTLVGSNTDAINIALGDLNDDGALDIVLCNYLNKLSQVYLNNPNNKGSFAGPATLAGSGKLSDGVGLGDFDGDGLLDIVLANFGQPSQVYLNDPNNKGSFGSPRTLTGSDNKSISVGVGDLNGDGALDILVGNYLGQLSQIYLNDGGGSFAPPLALAGSGKDTTRLALGDLDGDGALDIVMGNNGLPSQVFLNNGTSGLAAPTPLAGSGSNSFGVAVGDLDGDGARDIVLSNKDQPSQIFFNRNDGAGGFTLPTVLPGSAGNEARSLALGDLNNDDALDIVLGNFGQPSLLYFNAANNPGSFTAATPLAGSGGRTQSVALGDLNNDGALDIVLANPDEANQVFMNNPASPGSFGAPIALAGDLRSSLGVALGDLNGDGALDIVFGNYGQPGRVYLNDGTGDFTNVAPSNLPGDGALSQGLGVADLNGDGALDVVFSNFRQPSQVLLNRNDGSGDFEAPVDVPGSGNFSNRMALADLNGDGAPDLVLTTSNNQPSTVYLNRNDGSGGFGAPINIPGSGGGVLGVAAGDLNDDGALDLVLAAGAGRLGSAGQLSLVYLNHLARPARLPDNPPTVAVDQPGPDANFYATPTILSSGVVSITYRLFDREGDAVRAISATFSLDGGNNWQPAIAATGTITRNLATAGAPNCSSAGCSYTYRWDVFASGVFGQSDNVVFRIQAYPDVRPRQDHTAGLFLRPYASAQTFPFRVRGTQVQVSRDNQPAGGALVFRLPKGQTSAAQPISSGSRPFVTDIQGFLQGRGTLNEGDQIVALVPISSTKTYTIYLTSAAPISTGLQMQPVSGDGVQHLAVSSANPLLLFNLKVALEWDAREDTRYLNQLQFDLQRASGFLYNWSNGQIALGRITIYHDRQQWNEADVRIYSSNRLRPSANIGGIATNLVPDPAHPNDIIYAPGQIRMGATWNRYGLAGSSLSEDWARTFAHELGHYALFLDDNYLGTNDDGLIVAVDSCPGAMGDPYVATYIKFRTAADWLPACQATLSQQGAGRPDWSTIETFYPQLVAPQSAYAGQLAGPTTLPLAVTQIAVAPYSAVTPLEAPIFYLAQAENGGPYTPGLTARGFLFQDDRISELGRPALGQVNARGARPGDRVCLYDTPNGRLGCTTVAPGDEKLPVAAVSSWQPEITITPVTSRTIAVQVGNLTLANGQSLIAQLYPADDSAPPAVPLAPGADGFSGVLSVCATCEPVLEGYVLVRVAGAAPLREAVSKYSLGGNPGFIRLGGGFIRLGGGFIRLGGGFIRLGGAPLASADGELTVVGEGLEFAEGQIISLQAASHIPDPPPGRTVVGSAYWLNASAGAPDLRGTSINFSYLGSEVPAGEEDGVQVYYWDQTQAPPAWRQLPTERNSYYNTASAHNQGPGLYAVMSSITLPLTGPGWNLIAYPVQATQPVTQALASIDGFYTTVYGYDPTDSADPWQVYDIGVPAWVNDLTSLQFGRGYWINATETISLYLKSSLSQPSAAASTASGIPAPPATYYGVLSATPGFTPAAGVAVIASVNGNVCGRSQTRLVDGQVVYVVDVLANGAGSAVDCGMAGQRVTITIGTLTLTTTWDNSRPRRLEVSDASVYLPLVTR